MLNSIIRFSIGNKLIVGVFVAALIGYGSYQLTKLPVDAVPDITDNQVQVITVAPSLGATDIERLITFPVEQANSNLPGLKELRSFSRFGLSLVTIVFDDNTDIYLARQQVTERLQNVREVIPAGIGNPELGPVSTGLGEIYQYVVKAAKGFEHRYDITELRTIQDWIIRRQLTGVKGVAEVSSFGGKLMQYEIAVDPARLHAHGLTISDVFAAIEANNANTGGAYIEKGSTVLSIRTEGLLGSFEDVKNIAIRTTKTGSPLLVKDVAEVRRGSATRFGAMTYNDEGEVAGAVVMMLKGANSSDVIRNVKDRIEEIRKTLPEGVVIEPFLDRSKMVGNAISTVETNLLEGALIVVFVLVLFLGNLRAGLIVASVIPLSMLFAVIMMNTFGVSGNLMSLGALDFGLIVDGAVIIVEAVMHRLHVKGRFGGLTALSKKQMDEETGVSAGKMMSSAVFGQLIILVVYLPVLTLQGIEGKMFRPMAQTVTFALLGAFILSLTYIPMMSALLLSRRLVHKRNFSDRMMDWILRGYQPALARIIAYKRSTVAVVIALFVAALAVLFSLGGEFIPALEEGDFAVETRLLTGSSLDASIEAAKKSARILSRFPEVEKIVTKTGSGEVPTDPMPMEASDIMVILKDKSTWTSAKSFNELADTMGKALSEIPGVTYSFQYPVQMRFNELMTGAKQDVVCKIFGDDLDTLSKYATKLASLIAGTEGVRDLYVETVTGVPQIVIAYNREAMAQYGLSVASLNSIVSAAFAGHVAGKVFDGEKRFDLVVRLDSSNRRSIDQVSGLLVPLPGGVQLPLSHLARVEIHDGPNQIQREDAKRRIIVGFNVRGRDVQSIVKEVQAKADSRIRFPAGYYLTYGGAFENMNAAAARLGIAVPVALVLIFLLLYFSFSSLKHSLLIYSAIPLSAIGGIFALALRQMPFSISAGIGFIALFGVAVLNGIVLVAEFNRLKREGMSDLKQIVTEGTRLRLRPVLMTATVASFGFLPMALSQGAGAEVQRPLATVVIGGLLIATALTLFVLPVLYILFEKVRVRRKGNAASGLLLVLALFCIPQQGDAQIKVRLQASLDTAMKNSLLMRNEMLMAEYRQMQARAGSDVPQTGVQAEYGQFNSIYYDNKITVSQSLNFPSVYSRQKQLASSGEAESGFQLKSRQAELLRDVARVYNTVLMLAAKEALLARSDSHFVRLKQVANELFKTGENNVVDKITVEAQHGQLMLQLGRVRAALQEQLLLFRLLLNTGAELVPDDADSRMSLAAAPDTTGIRAHPRIQLLRQQSVTAERLLKLEKARLMPDMYVGYNNMSIRGIGADETYHPGSSRFQSLQFGLGIPLFARAQKARISMTKWGRLLSENNYESGFRMMQYETRSAIEKYSRSLGTLNYYEQTAMPNLKTLLGSASAQFSAGNISYREWVALNAQAASLRSEYIEALHEFNESVITLNYLLGK